MSEAAPTPVERARDAATSGRIREAHGICEDALLINPQDHPCRAMLGTLLAVQGFHEMAYRELVKAVEADPTQIGWRLNLAGTARMVDRLEESLKLVMQLVGEAGDHSGVLQSAGLTLEEDRQWDSARVALLRAIALDPNNAEAHFALGEHLLRAGEWGPGFAEYEWRHETPEGKKNPLPTFTSARWNGMCIPHGTLVVVCDQGYGDVIMFARFLAEARRRVDKLVLGTPPSMATLMARVPGVDEVFAEWDKAPPHAAHIRLTSLPWVLGADHPSNYLPADGKLIRQENLDQDLWGKFHDALPQDGRIKVGLAIAGRPTHPNDCRRSMPGHTLSGLNVLTKDCVFVAVQPDSEVGLHIHQAMRFDLPTFDHTAALLSNLDLLVTVDTGVAHLGASLGLPTWVMMAHAGEWRWGRPERFGGCGTSPWYPDVVRKFQQHHPGRWDACGAGVFHALNNFRKGDAR